MIKILQNHRERIAELCSRYQVVSLSVFGSALGDDYIPGQSDLDLLVDFGDLKDYARVDAYFELHQELQNLLGVDVDLVMIGAVKNRFIAAEIARTRQELYAA